jgi:uncharacterized protein YkwD
MTLWSGLRHGNWNEIEMRRIVAGRSVVGAAVGVAIVVVSFSTFVFSGRGGASKASAGRAAPSPTTTSSTTPTISTTTPPTTTTVAPPPPTDAPAPVAAPANDPPPPPAPSPPPAPAPAPAPGACDGGPSALIDATNRDRGANGLAGLCASATLNGMAQRWANWMAQNNSLTHQDLNALIGGLPFSAMGENILDGPGTMAATQMEAAWMASPEHRANILQAAFRVAGVGIAFGADGRVWAVVDFGG